MPKRRRARREGKKKKIYGFNKGRREKKVTDPWPYSESFQRFQNLTNSITLISQTLNLPEKLVF